VDGIPIIIDPRKSLFDPDSIESCSPENLAAAGAGRSAKSGAAKGALRSQVLKRLAPAIAKHPKSVTLAFGRRSWL
jgi:hypothetical protein